MRQEIVFVVDGYFHVLTVEFDGIPRRRKEHARGDFHRDTKEICSLFCKRLFRVDSLEQVDRQV